MKKYLVLSLVLALLLSMLAGCSNAGTTDSSETETTQTEDAAETAEVSQDTADDAQAEDESDSASSAEPTEMQAEAELETEPEAEQKTISYPLSDAATLSMWAQIQGSMIVSEWNELYILDEVTEKTGVALDITTVSDATAEEQFNLMVAAQVAYDLIMAPELFYAGGAEAAWNDEVIIDLTDLLPDYAPDYLSYVESLSPEVQATVKNGDQFLTIYAIADAYYTLAGCIIRQDWLDDLQLDRPTDLDSLTDVLKAFYSAYDAPYTLFTTDASLSYLSDLFNTSIVGYSQTSLPVYVTDGTVYCSYATDEYRNYLEWFNEMYELGVINSDFYSVHPLTIRTASGNGQTGFWYARCETIDEWQLYVEDESILEYCNPQPMTYMTDEDGIFNWGSEESYSEALTAFSISAYSENAALALEFLNYFFTEEGSVLANYGVENYTWEYNDQGEISWTEVVTNNADGLSVQTAVNTYTGTALLPCLQIANRTFSTYSETAQLFLEYCNTNITSDHAYPSAAALTTAQSSEVSGDITNMLTYISEQVLKFMTGSLEINDENWETFQSTLANMGLSKVLEMYQKNYDAYISQFA